MPPFAESGFPELELSPSPTERAAQVRLLRNVFSVLARRHLERKTLAWQFLPKLAATAAVAAAVDEIVQALPPDEDFGSFSELQARRDDTGVVRLRR